MQKGLRFIGFAASALALAALSPLPAKAADPAPAAASGYVLPDTDSWEISSADGEPYRIFVSRPNGPPPAEGYPVLYVLDGNAYFAGFAEARRVVERTSQGDDNVGRSIIVAIGYPTDDPFNARRLYDFTPPNPKTLPAVQQRLAGLRAGGQDRFLDFILNRLRPEVARRYSVNPHRQALFGHSLGGLFALHVLYTRPDAFHAIISASPSQWWNDQAILAEERAFAARLTQGKAARPPSRLLLLAGEREEHVANIWDTETLAERLAPLSAYGLRTRFQMLDGEIHVTVPSRAVTSTLRFAFTLP